MPNTEVKLTNAESTWPEAAREDRKLLIKEKTLTNVGVFFHMPGLPIRTGYRDSRRTSFEGYRVIFLKEVFLNYIKPWMNEPN